MTPGGPGLLFGSMSSGLDFYTAIFLPMKSPSLSIHPSISGSRSYSGPGPFNVLPTWGLLANSDVPMGLQLTSTLSPSLFVCLSLLLLLLLLFFFFFGLFRTAPVHVLFAGLS